MNVELVYRGMLKSKGSHLRQSTDHLRQSEA